MGAVRTLPRRRVTRVLVAIVCVALVTGCGREAATVSSELPDNLDGPFVVSRVVDGDTIKLSNGEAVRLIGIDTPETVDPRRPVQCFGEEASAHAREILEGEHVYLEYDPTQGMLDRYGRTLAYVWTADGDLVNESLISEGYAHEYTYEVPYRYQEQFDAAEADARNGERGLWSPKTCAGYTDQSYDDA